MTRRHNAHKSALLLDDTPPRKPPRYKVNTSSTTSGMTFILDRQNPGHVTPVVYYTPRAHLKMQHLVRKCHKEVGWMCMVKEVAQRVYVIYEILIPEQTVTSVETDISAAGMAGLTDEMLDALEDGAGMYAWFHSHVNMGVSPSTQDEEQVAEFLEGQKVFIRGIVNKHGAQKVDVYYPELGIAFNCVETDVLWDVLDKDEITLMDKQIKDRVKEQVIVNHNAGNRTYGVGNPTGFQQLGRASGPQSTMNNFDDGDDPDDWSLRPSWEFMRD